MLTQTTEKIVKTLTQKVRVLSIGQLAHAWFTNCKAPLEAAKRAAKTLSEKGYVYSAKAMVTEIEMPKPIVCWEPNRVPNMGFEAISYQSKKRWNVSPKKTVVLTASNYARSQFGGETQCIREAELSHDIAVSNVYLIQPPSVQNDWVPENDIDDEFGGKKPDAIIQQGSTTVIDVIGRGYSASKIEGIWTKFSSYRGELW